MAAIQRKIISGSGPGVKKAFWFWLLAVTMPMLLGKVMVSMYFDHVKSQKRAVLQAELSADLQKFKKFVEVEAFVGEAIKQTEKELGLPVLFENSHERLKNEAPEPLSRKKHDFLHLLSSVFARKTGTQPLLALALSADRREVKKYLSPAGSKYLGNPGRTALKIFMKSLYEISKQGGTAKVSKIFPQISQNLLATNLDFSFAHRKLISSFSLKKGGKRLFVYFSFFPNDYAQASSVSGFFVVVDEGSLSQEKRFNWALHHDLPKHIQRKFALLPASLTLENIYAKDGKVAALLPLPLSALRVGSHLKEDLLNKNIKNNLLTKKPAKVFFLVTYAKLKSINDFWLSAITDYIGIFLLVANFLTLYFLKQLCLAGQISLKIHTKLFLSIFAGAIMPMAAFFIIASQYMDFYQKLLLSNYEKSLIQTLHLFELNIANNELMQQRKLKEFRKEIGKIKNLKPEIIEQRLESELGKLHDGYVFVRSDGLILEDFSKIPDFSKKDRDKFALLVKLYKSSVIKVFAKMNIFAGERVDKLKQTSDGRNMLVLGDLFADMDVDNFCLQDGDYFQTDKEQKDHYRMISYTLYPQPAEEKQLWAFVVFLQNGKRLVSEFLDQQAKDWKFYFRKDKDAVSRTAVYALNTSEGQSSGFAGAWPENLIKEKSFVAAAERVITGPTTDSWKNYSADGMPIVFGARKLFKLPYVVVSRAEFLNVNLQQSLVLVFLLLLVLYAVLLIVILTYALSDVFLRPIKTLLAATQFINDGSFPLIEFKSDSELAKIVYRFNQMSVGLRQRKTLERFVSADATRTVVDESLNLTQHIGKKIKAAVLFTHIRNFNQLCEKMTAKDIIALVNMYFAEFEPEISANHGSIDKYIGDAIMVVFNQDGENEKKLCQRACNAALAMLAALTRLNDNLRKNGKPEIAVGIGISTGEVIRGKIGSHQGRKDFTVIGDVVNLAARLEAISHQKASSAIMVSDNVMARAQQEFSFELFGKIEIKGKRAKQEVYELLAKK